MRNFTNSLIIYIVCLRFFITIVSQNVYGRQMKTGKRDLIKVGEKKKRET